MSTYFIANIGIDDASRLQDYREQVPALIEKHGGKYLVRGADAQVMEGTWVPDRLVVLEFPDRESALAFYNDPEYEPHKAQRLSVSDTSLILIDGVE